MRRPPVVALVLLLLWAGVAPALALEPPSAGAITNGSARLPHPPIVVTGAGTGAAVGTGMLSGSGTATDPYVIEGWEVDVRALGVGGVRSDVLAGIQVRDTTAHVVVRDNLVRLAAGVGILVQNAPNVKVESNEVRVTAPVAGPTASATGIAVTGTAIVRANEVLLANHGASASTGIRLTGGAPSIYWNTVASTAGNVGTLSGIVVEGGGAHVWSNVVRHEASAPQVLAGIAARSTFAAIVEDNTVTTTQGARAGHGLAITTAQHTRVEGNVVQKAPMGLLLGGGSSNTVRDNLVEDTRVGLVVDLERGATVTDNTITGTSYGFGVLGSQEAHYRHARIEGNTANGLPILVYRDLEDQVLDLASAGPLAYLGILESHDVRVANAQVVGGVQGILVGASSGVRIEGATVTGAFRAVEAVWSFGITFDDLDGGGALLSWCSYCRVENSTLTAGARPVSSTDPLIGTVGTTLTYGIAINGASIGAAVADVTVTGADRGLLVRDALKLTVQGSFFSENGRGIDLTASDNAVLSGNAIRGNGLGLYALSSVTDARENWWGDKNGPHAGDGVLIHGMDPVQLSPWLTSSPTSAGDKT